LMMTVLLVLKMNFPSLVRVLRRAETPPS